MVNIIPKRCLCCKGFIPTIRPSWWKRPLTASHYARLKYCSYACSSSVRNKTETKWGRKSKKPDIEILNRLWSQTRSYKKMGQILGVSYPAIKKWMGHQKYLKDPRLLYREEKAVGRRRVGKPNLIVRKTYYKNYYLKNKEKKRQYYLSRKKALLV